MPSKILKAYRDNLASQGLVDDRDDQFLIQEIGPIIQSEAPHLFDQDPELGQLWSEIRDANAPSLGGEFTRAFKSGAQGLAGTALSGASLLTGSDYLREKAASFDQDAAENAPTIPTIEDVAPGRTGVSKALSRDALRYVISKAGQVAPSVAEAGVTALAGAALGTAAAPGPGTIAGASAGLLARGMVKSAIRQLVTRGVAKEMVAKGLVREATEEALEQALRAGSKEVADVVGRQALAVGAKRGMAATSFANSYLLNAGDVYSEGGDRPTAMALGLISAVPDTVLPTYLLGKLFPGVAASKAKDLGRMYIADRAKKVLEAAGVAATEGATETFQEAINVVARNLKEDKDPLTFTDADMKRLREAGITGLVGGGLAAPAVLISPAAEGVPSAPPSPPPVVPAPVPIAPVEAAPLAPVVPPVAEAPVAPLPSTDVVPAELAAVAAAAVPAPSAEQIGRQMMGDTPEARADAEVRRQAFAMAGAPVPNAASEVEVNQREAEQLGRAMAGEGLPLPAQPPALEQQPVPSPATPVTARPPAPVVFVGIQEGLPAADGRPAVAGFEIFNLTQDIPGHPKGSTETRETLEKKGFDVPAVVEMPQAAPALPAEPTLAPPPAAAAPSAPVFDQGAVIEGAPSVDFRTNDEFLNFTPVQWQQALAASLEAGPRSDKTGNRSLTRVAVALQAPDGRVVLAGLTLPQKTLTTSGTTTFKEPALQRMGVSRAGRRAVEAGGNHPATIQDVVAAGFRPISVVHFAGEPTKIYQSFADQKAFDEAWGATAKTQGANIRPPAMTAQPAITRNREADLTRRIDQLGMELLRAKGAARQSLVDQIKDLYAQLELVAGRDQLQIGETGIEENNYRLGRQQTVQSADRTNEFQAVMTNLRNMGMRVDLFAKEIFAQGAREPIVQQIQLLQQQLATAVGGQRADLMARIAMRESRLADIDKAVGVAYSPWHIAVSVNDVQSSNLSNLVTLLHEAAESLTMRLGPVAKGNVLRAVDATMADLQAKAQAAAARTGVPVSTTTSAADLLAETLAQKLAAEGVGDAPSLAQAIVRWVKDLYYRVAMAAQRGFGGEPDIETSMNWFENQLRREVGGDLDYRLTNLLDRYLVLPAIEQVRKFQGQKDTPGGVADFLDPLEQQIRQPWVDPLTPDAMRWNVEFRQSDAPTDQNIPDPEARARIDSAAVNEVLEFGKRLHAQVAPDMPWEQFWKLVGRGDDPALLLADQERRVPGSQTARIGGERMTRPMNDLASLNARILVEKIHLRQLREVARNKKAIAEAEAAMVSQAKEMNRVEADFRNAALHEDTLREKLKVMVRSLVRNIQRGYDTAHTHGRLAEAIRQAEGRIRPLAGSLPASAQAGGRRHSPPLRFRAGARRARPAAGGDDQCRDRHGHPGERRDESAAPGDGQQPPARGGGCRTRPFQHRASRPDPAGLAARHHQIPGDPRGAGQDPHGDIRGTERDGAQDRRAGERQGLGRAPEGRIPQAPTLASDPAEPDTGFRGSGCHFGEGHPHDGCPRRGDAAQRRRGVHRMVPGRGRGVHSHDPGRRRLHFREAKAPIQPRWVCVRQRPDQA
jgi:hypothetical protein